jgi:hypothetical protein
LTDLVAELRRIEVLRDDADLGAIGGVDVQIEDESVQVDDTNVDDIVDLTLTGRASASVDGEALPIGDLLLDNDADPSELTAEASDPEEFELPLAAVREDGRWYVSAFYTIAELARHDQDEVPDIPVEGIPAVGADSPEDAMDNMIDGIEALDLEGIIGSLNPNEFEALQRYAPLFIADAQADIDDSDAAISIDDPEYTVSGSGDERSVAVDFIRITVNDEEDPGTVTLQDGCWTVEAGGETVNTCELGDDMSQLEDLFDDPEPVRQLIDVFRTTFADYENPGFTVNQVDGKWYFSPIGTTADQLLAVLRAVDRQEVEDLIAAIEDAMESDVEINADELVPADELIDDYTNPNKDATATTVVEDDATTATDDTSGDTSTDPSTADDPAAECYLEDEGQAAAACFEQLVEAGDIEPAEVPVYLRAPECGLADIFWTGDYYDLPDEEFVTVVEEAAPCFQDKVAAGELDPNDLPIELDAPQCLDGRNWYTAIEDQPYYDALIECASQ